MPLLVALGLDDGLDEALAVQEEVLAACGRRVPTDQNPAKRLALRLGAAGLVLAYGTGGLGSVAGRRLGTQLNENAKQPALFAELPELGHNEIVAWQRPSAYDRAALVWLRDRAGEHARVEPRVAVVSELARPRAATLDTLTSTGRHPLARLAGLVLTVDLVSVYAALARDEDPTPIAYIDRLKRVLAQRPAAPAEPPGAS